MDSQNSEMLGLVNQFFGKLFQLWAEEHPDRSIAPILQVVNLDQESILLGRQVARFNQYYQVLCLIAQANPSPGFFLRLGKSYNIYDLGIVGYALISANNLQRSWELSSVLVKHPLHFERLLTDESVELHLFSDLHPEPLRIALCEEWLLGTWAWTCQRLPELNQCTEVRLELSYPAPTYAQLYSELFPGKVLFNQPVTRLCFPIEFNELTFSTANQSVSRLCYEYSLASSQVDSTSLEFIDQVRMYLLQSPDIAEASLEKAADNFGLPRHTFQRRLARHNTSFRQLLLQTRMSLSRQYLLSTEMSVNEIAYRVGYEHTPSFYRAFQSHHGMTPEQYRRHESSSTLTESNLMTG